MKAGQISEQSRRNTTLWVGALRYYMGRMTYAVEEFCELLIAEWPNLDDRTKELIRRDLGEQMARDDKDRAENRNYKRLGHDCDRASWERVSKLWESK